MTAKEDRKTRYGSKEHTVRKILEGGKGKATKYEWQGNEGTRCQGQGLRLARNVGSKFEVKSLNVDGAWQSSFQLLDPLTINAARIIILPRPQSLPKLYMFTSS